MSLYSLITLENLTIRISAINRRVHVIANLKGQNYLIDLIIKFAPMILIRPTPNPHGLGDFK